MLNYIAYPVLMYYYVEAEKTNPDQSSGRRMWIPVNICLSFLISIEYFFMLYLERKFEREEEELLKKNDGDKKFSKLAIINSKS